MTEKISKTLLDQRLRNRIMEALLWIAEGVDNWGIAEYFNQFYDVTGPDGQPQPNGAMSRDEMRGLEALCCLMNLACDATPDFTEAQFKASVWPGRIEPEARRTLEVFLRRGRHGEEAVEAEPSFEDGQAWYAQARGRT